MAATHSGGWSQRDDVHCLMRGSLSDLGMERIESSYRLPLLSRELMKVPHPQQLRIGQLAFAITCAMSVPMLAQAQEHRDDTITELDPMVVTAQKKDELLQDVPISIKVVDAETLAVINADGLDDIARLVPSLSMTNIARGSNQVQIRGLGSNVASVGTVAIYNDGVVSPSRIQSSGTFAEQDSMLFDVDRVEVLRGPQGTLYGEGSFGGVINIISKRPNTRDTEASFAGSLFGIKGGSFSNTDIRAMVNFPLSQDVLAVRAVGYRLDRDGYIDAVDVLPVLLGAGPPVLIKENANTEEITGGRFLATLTPGDAFDATVIIKSEKTRLGVTSTVSPTLIAGINSLVGTGFRPEFTQAVFSPAIGGETKVNEGVLELNILTPLGQLTSVTGVGEVKENNSNGLSADSKSRTTEIRLSSDNDGPLNGIVGAYYRHAERGVSISGFPFVDNSVTQRSVFGQMYWEFAPRLNATLGLRYETQSVDGTDQLNSLPRVSGKFSSFLPKAAIDFKADEDTLYYASIAKGFRAGGVNADESMGTDPSYIQAFNPDKIWNYEAGLKKSFLDRRLTVNATVFYIDWSDIQIDRAIDSLVSPPTQFIVINGEDAHSFGVEVDVYFRPTPDWDITLGGSLLQAQYDGGTIDSGDETDIPIDGMQLPSTPRYLLNASVQRNFSIGSLDAFVRGDYSLRGSSYGDVPNTPSVGFFGVGELRSGSSQSLNLRAGVRRQNWELQAFITNVTNEGDSTFTYFDGGFADLSVLLPPRTVGLNVKFLY